MISTEDMLSWVWRVKKYLKDISDILNWSTYKYMYLITNLTVAEMSEHIFER